MGTEQQVIGNEDFCDGFSDGYWGRPVKDDDNKDYMDGYGRGYETAERQSALSGDYYANRKAV